MMEYRRKEVPTQKREKEEEEEEEEVEADYRVAGSHPF